MVVGLGNPGSRYENTPHNVGFAALEELASFLGVSLRRSWRFRARAGKSALDDTEVLLVQPLTFMNNSGSVVAAMLRYRQIAPEDLVVISDDADLKIGRIRVRPGGSSGGHKGIESIIGQLGANNFVRIRIGIGRSADRADLVEYVLRPFSTAEKALAREMEKLAAEAVRHVITTGVTSAMNRYNGIDRFPASGTGS